MDRDDILDKIMLASLDRANAMLQIGKDALAGEFDLVFQRRGTIKTLNETIEQYAEMLTQKVASTTEEES